MHSPAQWDDEYDLVVLGAGAGGMTAALVAAIEGLRTLVIERTRWIGGTTARSSGTVWIPDNPHQRRLGIPDDAQAAREYLDALVGDRADRALREAFIAAGPEMIDYSDAHTDVRFQAYRHHPDYRQELPGRGERRAAAGAAAVRRADARPGISTASRWPLRELMLFGGMMVTRGEAARLLRIGRIVGLARSRSAPDGALSRGSAALPARDAARSGQRAGGAAVQEPARSPGRDLVRGADVAARRGGGRACGLVVERDGARVAVRARRGIVLAGGGFPASAALRERYLPQARAAIHARVRRLRRRDARARAGRSAPRSARRGRTTRSGFRARSRRARTVRPPSIRTSSSTARSRGSSRSIRRDGGSSTRRCRTTSSRARCTARTGACRPSPPGSSAIGASSGSTASE